MNFKEKTEMRMPPILLGNFRQLRAVNPRQRCEKSTQKFWEICFMPAKTSGYYKIHCEDVERLNSNLINFDEKPFPYYKNKGHAINDSFNP
jgi:hypothetical protein